MKLQWATMGDDTFQPCGETVSKLEPGYYKAGNSGGMFPRMVLSRIDLVTDNLKVLADSPAEKVIDSIQKFWKARDRFAKHGIIHKRSILLEGPPGTGKTSIANLVAKFVVENGGVVFFATCGTLGPTMEALAHFRKVQKEPLMVVMEDFDGLMNGRDIHLLMHLLDGANQINNVIFLSTTNFLDRIDARFTKRPSRIDEILHVGKPSAATRQSYLEGLLKEFGVPSHELPVWVQATDGLMIAHLREAVIATQVLGRPLDETVERLKSMVPTGGQQRGSLASLLQQKSALEDLINEHVVDATEYNDDDQPVFAAQGN